MERHRKGGDVGMAFLPEIRPRRQVFLALQRISDPAELPSASYAQLASTPHGLNAVARRGLARKSGAHPNGCKERRGSTCKPRHGGPGRRSDLPNSRSRVIATALRTER